MSKLPTHYCDDNECCSFCAPSSKSCKCHKTALEMLVEQRDRLLEAALEIESAWMTGGMNLAHPAFITLTRAISRVEDAR